MPSIKTDIVIIGAGLTGLSLAYYLHQAGRSYVLIEASTRIGGRILTQASEGNAPVELGATWFGKQHVALTALLQELGITSFEQFMGKKAVYEPVSTSAAQLVSLPPNDAPSYRIKGGTSVLVEALSKGLDKGCLHLDEKVQAIEASREACTVRSTNATYTCTKVVSTLPPNLLAQGVHLSPSLPYEVQQLLSSTHTWMGESIKVALTFDTPFWKEPNTSGTLFSNVGPVSELYDHSNFEASLFALKGFFNPSYHQVTREERLEILLNQLEQYYGSVIRSFRSYEEMVWRNAPFTYAPYPKEVRPHQNNGHPLYQQAYLHQRLYIAGSETTDQHPGYMDGAVRSAQWVLRQLV